MVWCQCSLKISGTGLKSQCRQVHHCIRTKENVPHTQTHFSVKDQNSVPVVKIQYINNGKNFKLENLHFLWKYSMIAYCLIILQSSWRCWKWVEIQSSSRAVKTGWIGIVENVPDGWNVAEIC